MLQIGRSLVRSQLVSLEFFIHIKSFWSHYGPGIDSASNRNEYQEYFLGSKGGRCIGMTTLPSSCANCREIWEPQSPGALWACNGIALPFYQSVQYPFALCYKSEGRWFDPRWCHWNFSFHPITLWPWGRLSL